MSTEKQVIDTQNKVSTTEIENIIKTNFKTIISNPTLASKLPPICIHSSPGVGKSTIVGGVAKELGVDFIDVRLAQMEPCDILGLPVPDKETKTMNWFINGRWPQDPKSRGILFLDELTSSPPETALAAYELILDRRLGNLYKLPDGWMIVAAGNLTTDRAIARTMSSALANRFMHFELQANAEDWVLWAQYNDVHPSVIGFINYRPGMLFNMENENLERGWPSPRSWERVSHMVKLYGNSGHCESSTLRKIVYGLVGNRAGVEFMEFYKVNREFDNVLDYMLNPNKEIVIPGRSDEKCALVSAMNYLLWRGKTKEDENQRLDGFYRIVMRLSPDFASMAMIAAMNGNSKEEKVNCADKLVEHSRYPEFAKKFGKSLKKRINLDV